jgi:hypothetical protein
MADVTSINQIVITAKDETGAAFTSVAANTKKVGDSVDVLHQQMQMIRADFDLLDKALQKGAFSGGEQLTDKIYQSLNKNIALMKSGLADASKAMEGGFTKATHAAEGLRLVTAGTTREVIVLAHEALTGNFSRIPGSIMVLFERMGALHSLVTLANAGWLAGAIAVGGFVAALVKGHAELNDFNAAMFKTGNFAGLTYASMLKLGDTIAATGKATIGAARELITDLVSSGKIGAAAFQQVTEGAVNYAKATRQSVQDVTKDIIKMFEDPSKGAKEMINTMGGLSVAEAEYIRHLQQRGQVQEAQAELARRFNEQAKFEAQQQQNNLGLIERGWNAIKAAASSAWDAMLGVGRQKTPQDVYNEAAAFLEAAKRNRPQAGYSNVPTVASTTNLNLAAAQDAVENAREMVRLTNQQGDALTRINTLEKIQLASQEEINRGKVGQIKDLEDAIAKIKLPFELKNLPLTADALARIAEISKQIRDINRSVDTERRAGLQGEIETQRDLALAWVKREMTENDTLLKIGRMTQIQHDQNETALRLEENLQKQIAEEKLLQISTIDAKERAQHQRKLADLKAEAVSIQQAGDLKITEDLHDLDVAIAKVHGQLPAFSADFLDLQKKMSDAFAAGKFGAKDTAEAMQNYAKATQLLLDQQPFAQRQREANQAMAQIAGQYSNFLQKLEDGNERIENQINLLGQAPDVIARATAELRAQQEIDKEIADLWVRYNSQLERFPQNAARILELINDLYGRQDALDRRAGDLAVAYQRAGHEISLWRKTIDDVADAGADFISDFVHNGSSAFKNLWQKFKDWAIDAFAKIAAQTIIVNIAGAISPQLGQLAGNQFGGQNNGILSLLTGGKNIFGGGGSNLIGGAGISFASSSVGQSLGLSTAVGGSAGIAADAVGGVAGGVAADVALTSAGSTFATAAAAIGTAMPYVAAALAIASAAGLFDKKPSEVRGRFLASTGTEGFEDNAYTKNSLGINLGFTDADTQQFSGEAAQVFNKIVDGAIDAFAERFSPEQKDHFKQVLLSTDFGAESGTFTTEDFIKKYGGQVLQKVVVAAFQELDPALAAVAAQFHGTADEIVTFGNTLLAIFDITKSIGNASFTANVNAALQNADQVTADKVLAFVGIVSQFGTSIEGLGPKLEALDPQSMIAFVDAMGGAQKAAEGFAFINANADRAAQAQTNLSQAWDKAGLSAEDLARAGLTSVSTHEQFMQLLNSLDLTTEHGRALYAMLVNEVAPAFVAVAGTADQAAQALKQQVASAEQFFNENFFSDAEKRAKQQIAWNKQITDAEAQLGVSIPRSNEAFRAWVLGIDRTTEAGERAYQTAILLAPAIFGLNDGLVVLKDTIDQLAVSAGSLTKAGAEAASKLISQFQQLANTSTGDFGQKLSVELGMLQDAMDDAVSKVVFTSRGPQALNGTVDERAYAIELAKEYEDISTQLARFTILSAQYDAARAEQLVQLEQEYADQKKLFAGNDSALAAAAIIFQQRWDAIVNGSTEAVQALDDFIAKIQQLADSTQGNAGQQARLEQALLAPKIASLSIDYAKLDPSSPAAVAIKKEIDQLSAYNTQLATQVQHFTTYSAQYGTDVANQLVALEGQYEQWKQSVMDLGGSADALAVLGEIFNERFQAIIDGIENGVDRLASLKQDIADYLKGLVISDISPLLPEDRVAQAKAALDHEIALAEGGDLKALGDVTQFTQTFLDLDREFKAGTQSFVDDFNYYTQKLADLAGTQPNGLPLDATSAIASALPSGSKLASSEDVAKSTAATQEQSRLLERLIADLADANTADSLAEREALQGAAEDISAAIAAGSERK